MQNNPQLFNPNYGNYVQYINTNQQIQQPQQRIQPQYYQNNQVVYQNIPNQQVQNLYNQNLNQQQIPQAKNNAQYMKQVQLFQNAQKQYNLQNQNNNQNANVGKGAIKTYPQAQPQNNNMANQHKLNNLNHGVQQNIQYQQAQNQQPNSKPKDKQLAVSHLNLSQSPNLEPVSPNQPAHLKIQQQQKQQHHYQQQQPQQQPHQHHRQQQIQPQNPQKMNVEENLTNTIAMVPPQVMQNPNQAPQQKLQNAPPQNNTKKSATFMTVRSLANLPYNAYPKAEYSTQPFNNIAGYGSNSYNGKAKNYNEDMLKVHIKDEGNLHISYFGVFDGHGGDKCSKFLKENMDMYLFTSTNFPKNPVEAIRDTFKKAESEFAKVAIQNNKLVDKSGSCALISLIINDMLYAINLGDSRALYSRKAGQELYQITRDHKPNDPKEKARIEKAGGKVYYANKATVNGKEVTLKEEQFGKGFTFPYRLWPSGLAVRKYLLIF